MYNFCSLHCYGCSLRTLYNTATKRKQDIEHRIKLLNRTKVQTLAPFGRANGFASRTGTDRQTDRHYYTLLNTHAKQLQTTNSRCACMFDCKIISRALSIMKPTKSSGREEVRIVPEEHGVHKHALGTFWHLGWVACRYRKYTSI